MRNFTRKLFNSLSMFGCCEMTIFKYPKGSLIINFMNFVMDIQLNASVQLVILRVRMSKIVIGAWKKSRIRLRA